MHRQHSDEFVQLEIRAEALNTLISCGLLRLEDLHPLSPHARQGIHRMLLQTLRAKR